MRSRLLLLAAVLVASYLAFGEFVSESMTMTPENMINDLGGRIAGFVASAREMIFG